LVFATLPAEASVGSVVKKFTHKVVSVITMPIRVMVDSVAMDYYASKGNYFAAAVFAEAIPNN